MNRKYIIAFAFGFVAMIGWNVFLIQRDDKMYKAYYHQKAIDTLKYRPTIEIR